MGGDFKVCVDPRYDSTSRAQRTGNEQRKILLKKLYQNQLMDVWRIQHAKERDYTFHSSVHRTYSRIDFFSWLSTGCWRQYLTRILKFQPSLIMPQ